MKFKKGDKVRCDEQLRAIGPRYQAPGTVAEISTDSYWVNKGTPVGVQMDYGPQPADWKPCPPLIAEYKRYSLMYFAEEELEHEERQEAFPAGARGAVCGVPEASAGVETFFGDCGV